MSKNIRKKSINLGRISNKTMKRHCFQKFKAYDKEYFGGFFSDKKIGIMTEEFVGNEEDWEGYACTCDDKMCVSINKELLDEMEAYIEDGNSDLVLAQLARINDVILHEMIHLFVYATAPNGRKVWGDKCRNFKDMEKKYCEGY